MIILLGGIWNLVASQTKAHARIIWDVSWSHDGNMFATASRDKMIKIWTCQDSKWICSLTIKCDESVTAIEFAPCSIKHG